MIDHPFLIACSIVLIAATPLVAQNHDAPLSAIDWLSQSVDAPEIIAPPLGLDEPPSAQSAESPDIQVTSLDQQTVDTVGLLSPSQTGLPASLWARTPESRLVSMVNQIGVDHVPAMRDLLNTLLLAEADPPLAAGSMGALFFARLDKLLDTGALSAAQALVERADPTTPNLYRRWFDISLLTGTETAACSALQRQPGLAPTYPARIFCLARNGDWTAAALTLNSARSLEEMSDEEELLMTLFLDPELAEELAGLPPPTRPSPLVFRIREAIGEAMFTNRLPLAFAHADLRNTVAWRNRILAAERLIGPGAIEFDLLLELYQERRPSASGGVWDRATLIQRFLRAMDSADTEVLTETLPLVWDMMVSFEAEVAFADHFGPRLLALDLDLSTPMVEIALLSGQYAQIAAVLGPQQSAAALAGAIASGQFEGIEASTALHAAVVAGLTDHPAPDEMHNAWAEGRVGEVLLSAIASFEEGQRGAYERIADALAILRMAGQDDLARNAAIQLVLRDARP